MHPTVVAKPLSNEAIAVPEWCTGLGWAHARRPAPQAVLDNADIARGADYWPRLRLGPLMWSSASVDFDSFR